MFKFLITTGVLLTTVFNSVSAQENSPLPPVLQTYLSYIQTNHYAMKYFGARKELAQIELDTAEKENLPQIAVQGYKGRSFTNTQNENFRTDSDFHEVSISQPIYTGGRRGSHIQEAEAGIKEADATNQKEVNQFLFDGSDAYINYYKQKALVKLHSEDVSNTEKRVTSVKEELRAGERSATDLAIAQSRHASALADLAKAKTDLQDAENRFMYFLDAKDPSEILQLDNKNPFQIGVFIPPTIEQFYKMNPKIREADAGIEVAVASVERAKSEYSPTVSLDGRAAYNDRRDEVGRKLDSDDYSILARYNLPLFSRGLEYSVRDKALSQERQARNRLLALSGDIMSNYRSSVQQFDSFNTIIDSYEIALKTSREAAKAAGQEYLYGFRTITELSDTEKDVLKAESDLINAKADRLKVILTILRDIDKLRT